MEAQSFAALGEALKQDMHTAMIYVDVTGSVRFWNQGAEALFGHAAADALGKSPEIIIPQELRSAHRTCFAQAMRTSWAGSANWDALEAAHASGALIAVEVLLTPISGADARPNGALAFFRRPRAAASS
jgi:PAS domain S-box-containing protein